MGLTPDGRQQASPSGYNRRHDFNAVGIVGSARRDDARGFRPIYHRAGLAVATPPENNAATADRGALTAVAALFATGFGGWLVVWGFGGIAQWVIANAARLQGLYMHAADLLEQRGLYAAELFAEQINVLWLVQVLRAIGGRLQGILSFGIVNFVLVIWGLLEIDPLGRRLRRIAREGAIDTAAEIATRLQTYMLVRFGMSMLTGLRFGPSLLFTGSSYNGSGR
jgi:hypothetical protein